MGLLDFLKPKEAAEPENPLKQVTEPNELFDELGDGPAVIYKHSNRCGTSFRALKEVRKFAEGNPDVPIFMIDVVRDPRVSNHVAQHFSVTHASPQVLVIRGGHSVWDGSHLDVTAGRLAEAVA